jgi:triphosphatase
VDLAIASKAERGYSLIAGKPPAAIKAAPVALAPDFTCEASFRSIARACLRQLVANRTPMLSGDAEGLHQMRVALRRLRAAISLFGDMLADPQTQEMKAQFRSINNELAPAREFDVFLERVVTPVAEDRSGGPGVAVLTAELQQERAEAFDRARAAVESARFRKLMIDTAAWIETGDWCNAADDCVSTLRERAIAVLAADELNRCWKRILKRGARLDHLDEEGRHRLRIQAKKLRYATEFFAEAFPGKKARKRRVDFLEGLERLQDALGDLNDIVVHEELTERIADPPNGNGQSRRRRATKAFAAGCLWGREEARVAAVLKDAERAYRILASAKPFWL